MFPNEATLVGQFLKPFFSPFCTREPPHKVLRGFVVTRTQLGLIFAIAARAFESRVTLAFSQWRAHTSLILKWHFWETGLTPFPLSLTHVPRGIFVRGWENGTWGEIKWIGICSFNCLHTSSLLRRRGYSARKTSIALIEKWEIKRQLKVVKWNQSWWYTAIEDWKKIWVNY